MIREELIDRLVCAKYMFENGAQTLDRGIPYASGLAVLAFQDAVELVLRVIAEHIHAQVKENSTFNQILDEIDKVGAVKLTHRSALNQLNKARVGFKHLGLAPRDEDASKFRRDLEGFFPTAINAFLSIDYESLSLVSLVRHRRTRNWLSKAETCLSEGKYHDSITASAVAEAVYKRSAQLFTGDRQKMRRMNLDLNLNGIGVVRAITDLFEEVDGQLQGIHGKLDLIGAGISYNDYSRFHDITPSVTMTLAETFYIEEWRDPDSATYEEALFCSSFARNMILKLQEGYRQARSFSKPTSSLKFRTTRATEIIVYPPKNDKATTEVLEVAEQGRVFLSGRDDGKSPYISVYYDEEKAYVLRDAMELIE